MLWGYLLPSGHMFHCSPALWPLTEHHTCCPLLWSPGDVRRPEFKSHSDDSEHLAARLLSGHQNKHRRFLLQPSHNTPCPALTASQRLNAKDAQDPALSNQNNVSVKGHAWRSESTFIPATLFHRVRLYSGGGRVFAVFLCWAPVWRYFPSICLSFSLLCSHINSQKEELNMHINESVNHICHCLRNDIKRSLFWWF